MLAGLIKRVDQLENWVRMALSRAGSAAFPTPNFALDNNGATVIGPGATITRASVASITRMTPAGRMEVSVQASFLQGGGAPGTISMQVTRDGVPIGVVKTNGPVASGSTQAFTVLVNDGIIDSLPHHYGWTATTTGGTIQVAANQSEIIAVEDT